MKEPYATNNADGSGCWLNAINLISFKYRLAENHAGIKMWLDEANLLNTRLPLALDVSKYRWSEKQYDAMISINCVHIMAKSDVQAMFAGCGGILSRGGLLVLYGPFNYGGQYSSESNAQFDLWLKERNSVSGIRDFEWLDSLAIRGGMTLLGDYEMPVNNRILCWSKKRERYHEKQRDGKRTLTRAGIFC